MHRGLSLHFSRLFENGAWYHDMGVNLGVIRVYIPQFLREGEGGGEGVACTEYTPHFSRENNFKINQLLKAFTKLI